MTVYVLIPKEAGDVMRKIAEMFLQTYPGELVPEYAIAFYAYRNRIPTDLISFDVTNYIPSGSEYVFYFPLTWVPLQAVYAQQVLLALIYKRDLPRKFSPDGVGLMHRHPSPGNLSDNVDCQFGTVSEDPSIANSVWNEVYPFNNGIISACTKWSSESETEVVTYSISDVVCKFCSTQDELKKAMFGAIEKTQFSRIVIVEGARRYLESVFGTASNSGG